MTPASIAAPSPAAPRARRADCLGCADCSGLCDSLLQLMRLPDLILKARG